MFTRTDDKSHHIKSKNINTARVTAQLRNQIKIAHVLVSFTTVRGGGGGGEIMIDF